MTEVDTVGITEEGVKVKVEEGAIVKVDTLDHSNEAIFIEEVMKEDIITTGIGRNEVILLVINEGNLNAGLKRDGHFLAETEDPVGGALIGVITGN
jgi:hypothetical protein